MQTIMKVVKELYGIILIQRMETIKYLKCVREKIIKKLSASGANSNIYTLNSYDPKVGRKAQKKFTKIAGPHH